MNDMRGIEAAPLGLHSFRGNGPGAMPRAGLNRRLWRGLIPILIGCALPGFAHAENTPIPSPVQDIIANRCLECHDADSEKGDVNLDQVSLRADTDSVYVMLLFTMMQGLIVSPVPAPSHCCTTESNAWAKTSSYSGGYSAQ